MKTNSSHILSQSIPSKIFRLISKDLLWNFFWLDTYSTNCPPYCVPCWSSNWGIKLFFVQHFQIFHVFSMNTVRPVTKPQVLVPHSVLITDLLLTKTTFRKENILLGLAYSLRGLFHYYHDKEHDESYHWSNRWRLNPDTQAGRERERGGGGPLANLGRENFF